MKFQKFLFCKLHNAFNPLFPTFETDDFDWLYFTPLHNLHLRVSVTDHQEAPLLKSPPPPPLPFHSEHRKIFPKLKENPNKQNQEQVMKSWELLFHTSPYTKCERVVCLLANIALQSINQILIGEPISHWPDPCKMQLNKTSHLWWTKSSSAISQSWTWLKMKNTYIENLALKTSVTVYLMQ